MVLRKEMIRECLEGLKPAVLMVIGQSMSAGINVLFKLASVSGADLRVLLAYRFLFGAVFIVPYAFFMERKNRPKLTWKVVFLAFLCGMLGGSLGQNLLLESLVQTSATFMAAMTNLIPAITYIIAASLRLETFGWNTKAGNAKIAGTIIGIGGAMVFTFYKGPEVVPWKTNVNLFNSIVHNHHANAKIQDRNLLLGIILSILGCITFSLWLVIQGKAIALYPCPQSFAALVVLMSAIQCLGFALCVQRDWNQWKLGWDLKLITVLYSGIVGSGIMFALIAICVRMRGPLFVSMFSPVLLVLVAIAGSLVLEEKLYVGSLIGCVIIIFGLYCVLWGKSNEIKKQQQLQPAPEEEEGDRDTNQCQNIQVEISGDVVSSGQTHVSSSSSGKETCDLIGPRK